MLRKFLILLVGVLIATTAFALPSIYVDYIDVQLNIPAYTKVWSQDDAWHNMGQGQGYVGSDIVFSSDTTNWPADPYRALSGTVIGFYGYTATLPPIDPYAEGYYESTDGATIWIESNCDLTGTLTISGNLKNASLDELPTWFTVSLCGTDVDPDSGFHLGNALPAGSNWVRDGAFPNTTPPQKGGYAGNNIAGGQAVNGLGACFYFGNQAFHPDQDAFTMTGAYGGFNFDAPVGPGTMKFLCRVERHGLSDHPGDYRATITPGFTVTP